MRVKSLVFVLLVLAVAARADEWKKTYPVSGTPELRVNTDDGSIQVTTWDQPSVQARVITQGWNIGRQVRVTESQDGNRIELEVRTPHIQIFGFSHHTVRVELSIPKQSNVDLQSGDGAITVNSVKGTMRLRSGDGAIEGSGLDGQLNASTADGHMKVQGRFDQLDLRSGDGRIDADVSQGSHMNSSWSVSSGDGAVTLRLPQNFSANLDAHTGDGHIRLDFPVSVSGHLNPQTIRGKINDGGPLLEIRTGDGSISIEKL